MDLTLDDLDELVQWGVDASNEGTLTAEGSAVLDRLVAYRDQLESQL